MMSHSERIQEAAKEIRCLRLMEAGEETVAAIISKHIPEQNELLTTALNRMIGRCSPSPSGRFRRLDQKLFSELYDIYTQAMHPAEWAKANPLATPSEPLGVTKHLGVEPVPTISSNAGVPIRPQEDCMSVKVSTPTHRCKVCGALWKLWSPGEVLSGDDGSWSLVSARCGKCCDNVAMDKQIEKILVTLDFVSIHPREWYEKMAAKENGCDFGVNGALATTPLISEPDSAKEK